MPEPGFRSLNISDEDLQRLEEVKRLEGCKTKTEAFRVLIREWERSRLPTIYAPTRKSTPLLDDHTVEVYTTSGLLIARVPADEPQYPQGITITQ